MKPTTQAAAERSSKRPAAAWFVAAGGAAVGAALAIPQDLSVRGPVLCPSRLLFGLPCPGCGLVRSWVAFGHGDVAAAFHYNWFGPVSFVAVALGCVLMLVLMATRGGEAATAAALSVLRSTPVAVVVIVWIGYGAVRAVVHLGGWTIPGIVPVS